MLNWSSEQQNLQTNVEFGFNFGRMKSTATSHVPLPMSMHRPDILPISALYSSAKCLASWRDTVLNFFHNAGLYIMAKLTVDKVLSKLEMNNWVLWCTNTRLLIRAIDDYSNSKQTNEVNISGNCNLSTITHAQYLRMYNVCVKITTLLLNL